MGRLVATSVCLAWLAQGEGVAHSGGAAPREGAARDRDIVLLHDPDHGFVPLVVRSAWVKVGTSRMAENSDAAARIWHELEIDVPLPKVDFATHVLLLFTERDAYEGGSGGAELEALLVHDDGSYEPAYAPVTGDSCYERSSPSWGVVYAVAARRDVLAPSRPLRLASPPRPWVLPARADEEPSPVACAPRIAPPAPGPGDDSVLTVPERGQVSLQYLRDGSAVFVVRHRDDTVDVLAGDVIGRQTLPGTDLAMDGLHEAVLWRCAERRFWSADGSYDEYGVPATPIAPWKSIDRYHASHIDDHSMRVPSRARYEGYGPRPVRPAPRRDPARRAKEVRPAALGSGLLVPYDYTVRDLQLGLPDATITALPVGTVMVIDSNLVLAGTSVRFLTNARTALVVAHGVGMPEATEPYFLPGIYAVRVRSDNGLDVVARLSHDWGGRRRRSYETKGIALEGSVSALVARSSATGVFGGEVKLGMRTSIWRAEDAASLTTALIGFDTGLALRARWLDADGPQGSRQWLGLDPLFENASASRQWVYPSLTGLLVPEVGLAHRTRTSLYLGWTVPVSYHFESKRTRLHPYGVSDVLGVEISPEALLSFPAGDPDWLVGAAVGVTVW
jgi:hypothetical protein